VREFQAKHEKRNEEPHASSGECIPRFIHFLVYSLEAHCWLEEP